MAINPKFIRAEELGIRGVKDVLVFDPDTLLVLHVRAGGATRSVSPVEVELECGCGCTV